MGSHSVSNNQTTDGLLRIALAALGICAWGKAPLGLCPSNAVQAAISAELALNRLHAQALFALRTTAQQVDNALNDWMAGTVGSAARVSGNANY